MPSNSDLLIYTVVDQRHYVYSDVFMWCAKRAYPDVEVKVFLNTRKPGSPRYEAACMRFLIHPDIDAAYYYCTDVDMLIVPEMPTLLEFHLKEINETGWCYSNAARFRETNGPNRLTGLHFMTAEWFVRTERAREEYRRLIDIGSFGHGKADDEEMLMEIVRKSGLPEAPNRPLVTRHHGIHIGTIRDNRDNVQKRKAAFRIRVKPPVAKYWQECVETEDYRRLYAEIKRRDDLAAWEFQELDRITKQMAKEIK